MVFHVYIQVSQHPACLYNVLDNLFEHRVIRKICGVNSLERKLPPLFFTVTVPISSHIFTSISPQERQNDISWQRVARKLKYSWSNLIAHNDYIFRVAVMVQTQQSCSKWPQCSLVVFSMHFLQAIIPISFLWQEPLSFFFLLNFVSMPGIR